MGVAGEYGIYTSTITESGSGGGDRVTRTPLVFDYSRNCFVPRRDMNCIDILYIVENKKERKKVGMDERTVPHI
jgi:hypothetical protein